MTIYTFRVLREDGTLEKRAVQLLNKAIDTLNNNPKIILGLGGDIEDHRNAMVGFINENIRDFLVSEVFTLNRRGNRFTIPHKDWLYYNQLEKVVEELLSQA